MKPFDENARCPKCGGADIHAQYGADQFQCHNWNCRVGKEHIHRYCRRCGYGWVEAPMDAGGGEQEAEQNVRLEE
jgi:hypothetical protein